MYSILVNSKTLNSSFSESTTTERTNNIDNGLNSLLCRKSIKLLHVFVINVIDRLMDIILLMSHPVYKIDSTNTIITFKNTVHPC